MGRSQDSFGKKEREKKKQKKREEKQKLKEERKANGGGGSLDDMIAYVDAYGNIVDTPPDPDSVEEVALEDINLGAAVIEEEDPIKKGRVTFFNEDKGFGFIQELDSRNDYFVHIGEVDGGQLKENNLVQFEVEPGPKGPVAVRVKLSK
jgi:cold shock CspA family protein